MGDVNLDHLARVVFARLLHYKVASSPCLGLSFGSSRGGGRGLSFTYWRVEHLRTLSSFLCKEDLSVLPHLFLQSFISISMDPWIFMLYFGYYVIIQCYVIYFIAKIVSFLSIESSSRFTLEFLQRAPSFKFLFIYF